MPLLSSRVRAVPRGVVAVLRPPRRASVRLAAPAARSPSSPSPRSTRACTTGAAPAAASRAAVATNTRTSFLRNLSATSSITNTRSVDSSRPRAAFASEASEDASEAASPSPRAFRLRPRPRPRRRAARCSNARATLNAHLESFPGGVSLAKAQQSTDDSLVNAAGARSRRGVHRRARGSIFAHQLSRGDDVDVASPRRAERGVERGVDSSRTRGDAQDPRSTRGRIRDPTRKRVHIVDVAEGPKRHALRGAVHALIRSSRGLNRSDDPLERGRERHLYRGEETEYFPTPTTRRRRCRARRSGTTPSPQTLGPSYARGTRNVCLGRLPGLLEGFGSRRAPLRVTPGPGHTPAGAEGGGGGGGGVRVRAAAGSSGGRRATSRQSRRHLGNQAGEVGGARDDAAGEGVDGAPGTIVEELRLADGVPHARASARRRGARRPRRRTRGRRRPPRPPLATPIPSGETTRASCSRSMPVRPCMGVSSPWIRDDGRDDTRAVAPSRDDAAQTVSVRAARGCASPSRRKSREEARATREGGDVPARATTTRRLRLDSRTNARTRPHAPPADRASMMRPTASAKIEANIASVLEASLVAGAGTARARRWRRSRAARGARARARRKKAAITIANARGRIRGHAARATRGARERPETPRVVVVQ